MKADITVIISQSVFARDDPHAFQEASVTCAHSFMTVSARSTVDAPSTNGLAPPAALASGDTANE